MVGKIKAQALKYFIISTLSEQVVTFFASVRTPREPREGTYPVRVTHARDLEIRKRNRLKQDGWMDTAAVRYRCWPVDVSRVHSRIEFVRMNNFPLPFSSLLAGSINQCEV